MSTAPTRQSILQLYRGLLRSAHKLEDYNFRSYAIRRVTLGFRENQALEGEALTKEYEEGIQQLAMLKRQAIISHLYPSKRSVMEPPLPGGQ